MTLVPGDDPTFWVAYDDVVSPVLRVIRQGRGRHTRDLSGRRGALYHSYWSRHRIYDIAADRRFRRTSLKFHGTLGNPGEESSQWLYRPPFFALLRSVRATPSVASCPYGAAASAWFPAKVSRSTSLFKLIVSVLSNNASREVLALALLFFVPLPLSLYFGQAMGVLLFAWYRAYVAFEHGQDTRRNCGLACFFSSQSILLVCSARPRIQASKARSGKSFRHCVCSRAPQLDHARARWGAFLSPTVLDLQKFPYHAYECATGTHDELAFGADQSVSDHV